MARTKKSKAYPLEVVHKNWISEYWDEYKDARKKKAGKDRLEEILFRVSRDFVKEFSTAEDAYESVVKAVRCELEAHSKLRNKHTTSIASRGKAKSAADLWADDNREEFQRLVEEEQRARGTPANLVFTLHSIVKGTIFKGKPDVEKKYQALAKARKVHPENLPYDEVRERADKNAVKEMNEMIMYFWTHHKVHMTVMCSRISGGKSKKPKVEVAVYETPDVLTNFEEVADHVGGIEDLNTDTYGKFADELFQDRVDRINQGRDAGDDEQPDENPPMFNKKGVTTVERMALEEDDNGWPLLPANFDDAHQHLRISDVTALLSHIAWRQRDDSVICAFQFKAFLEDGIVRPAVKTVLRKGKEPAAGRRNPSKEKATSAGGRTAKSTPEGAGNRKAEEQRNAEAGGKSSVVSTGGTQKKSAKRTRKVNPKAKVASAKAVQRGKDIDRNNDEDEDEDENSIVGRDEDEYRPPGEGPTGVPSQVQPATPDVSHQDAQFLRMMSQMNTSPYEFSSSSHQRYAFLESLCDHQHYRTLVTGLRAANHQNFDIGTNPLGKSNFAWWDRKVARIPEHSHTPQGSLDAAYFLLKSSNFTKRGECKYPPAPAEALILLSGSWESAWYLHTSLPANAWVQFVLPEFWTRMLIGLGALLPTPPTMDKSIEALRHLMFHSPRTSPPLSAVHKPSPAAVNTRLGQEPAPASPQLPVGKSRQSAPAPPQPTAGTSLKPAQPLPPDESAIRSSAVGSSKPYVPLNSVAPSDGSNLPPRAGTTSSDLSTIHEEEVSAPGSRPAGIHSTTAASFGGFMPRMVSAGGQSVPFTNGKEFLYETTAGPSHPTMAKGPSKPDQVKDTSHAKRTSTTVESTEIRHSTRPHVPKVMFDPSTTSPPVAQKRKANAQASEDPAAKRARSVSKPPSRAKPSSRNGGPKPASSRTNRSSAA
ncbi:hypothetical protein BXZ70DRAFT_1009297 [Cristinia sonorae]|uniref:Uncharacterized protein n=1 Tax=Cristinia sonorae TaxID=1940300 RepID=A0A8K0ULT4_9AGAR|nr:hypothetical protein BXZ70DRAFT_1009297 [Cristinia sonorae]